ncbi:response regulator transcription factor [Cytophagaceae bacterium YF14B1]|uniref:Response regulator transcription factor n=1 Tax=Xanthocytophaga flava TaxID=3048013 RepID=A0AAE3QLN6_9BACT|nr:response regulator transcription factor [Xanthocytophaga flavus]MDJ1479683.1 response regulator transcription factor [Xanthocytophaga flavus]
MEKIKVFLIDDHPMIIEGLKSSLNNTDTVDVVGAAINAFEGITFLKNNQVEVVLLDINLPDINGVEVCGKIRNEFPDIKVIALTTFNQYDYISEMMQSGASGYVLKNATRDELVEAIHAAKANKKYFSAEVTETLLQRSGDTANKIPKLTRREKEILALVAQGLTNQEIADKLFISILTVISHRKNLLTKFEVTNTAALISFAMKHQLL